jgi:hypothetical protein
MDNLDIIIYILDFLIPDPNAILNCSVINWIWRDIIYNYKRKYLRTVDMFICLSSRSKYYSNKIINHILDLKISDWCAERIRKLDECESKYRLLLNMIPNQNTNGLIAQPVLIDNVEKIIHTIFNTLEDFHLCLKKISFNKKTNIQEIYISKYENSDIINKLLWLVLLLNDSYIEQIFSRR